EDGIRVFHVTGVQTCALPISGHVKGLKGKTKLLAPVMFNVIFPLARITKGYGPTQVIGMGENLPKDVAREWAQFCSKPGYVINRSEERRVGVEGKRRWRTYDV